MQPQLCKVEGRNNKVELGMGHHSTLVVKRGSFYTIGTPLPVSGTAYSREGPIAAVTMKERRRCPCARLFLILGNEVTPAPRRTLRSSRRHRVWAQIRSWSLRSVRVRVRVQAMDAVMIIADWTGFSVTRIPYCIQSILASTVSTLLRSFYKSFRVIGDSVLSWSN